MATKKQKEAAPRHEAIMVAWLNGESCRAIGERLGISAARVHEIVTIALGHAKHSTVKYAQRGKQEFIDEVVAAYRQAFI